MSAPQGTIPGLEQVEDALGRRLPVDDVLDLVDEAIERASQAGAPGLLVRLAVLLEAAAATRADARGLAIAAARARAAASRLQPPSPLEEAGTVERAPVGAEPVAVRYAGWWRRALSILVDWFALLLVTVILPSDSDTAVLVVFFVLPVAYFAGLHAFVHGQTIGKALFGIAVRRAGGDEVGLPRAVTRAFVQGVLWITVIGGIVDSLMPLGDSRSRSLHDRVAGTVVVRVR